MNLKKKKERKNSIYFSKQHQMKTKANLITYFLYDKKGGSGRLSLLTSVQNDDNDVNHRVNYRKK